MSICSSNASRASVLESKSQTQSLQSTPVTKTVYQVDQQVKLLHLQAEVESLLQQLQIMKQQRLSATIGKNSN